METRFEGIVTSQPRRAGSLRVEKWRPDSRELSPRQRFNPDNLGGKVETRFEGIVTLYWIIEPQIEMWKSGDPIRGNCHPSPTIWILGEPVEKWRPDSRELSRKLTAQVNDPWWKSGDPIRGNCHASVARHFRASGKVETRFEGIVTRPCAVYRASRWKSGDPIRGNCHSNLPPLEAWNSGKVETRFEGIVTFRQRPICCRVLLVEKWRPDSRELSPCPLSSGSSLQWKSGDPIRGNCHADCALPERNVWKSGDPIRGNCH